MASIPSSAFTAEDYNSFRRPSSSLMRPLRGSDSRLKLRVGDSASTLLLNHGRSLMLDIATKPGTPRALARTHNLELTSGRISPIPSGELPSKNKITVRQSFVEVAGRGTDPSKQSSFKQSENNDLDELASRSMQDGGPDDGDEQILQSRHVIVEADSVGASDQRAVKSGHAGAFQSFTKRDLFFDMSSSDEHQASEERPRKRLRRPQALAPAQLNPAPPASADFMKKATRTKRRLPVDELVLLPERIRVARSASPAVTIGSPIDCHSSSEAGRPHLIQKSKRPRLFRPAGRITSPKSKTIGFRVPARGSAPTTQLNPKDSVRDRFVSGELQSSGMKTGFRRRRHVRPFLRGSCSWLQPYKELTIITEKQPWLPGEKCQSNHAISAHGTAAMVTNLEQQDASAIAPQLEHAIDSLFSEACIEVDQLSADVHARSSKSPDIGDVLHDALSPTQEDFEDDGSTTTVETFDEYDACEPSEDSMSRSSSSISSAEASDNDSDDSVETIEPEQRNHVPPVHGGAHIGPAIYPHVHMHQESRVFDKEINREPPDLPILHVKRAGHSAGDLPSMEMADDKWATNDDEEELLDVQAWSPMQEVEGETDLLLQTSRPISDFGAEHPQRPSAFGPSRPYEFSLKKTALQSDTIISTPTRSEDNQRSNPRQASSLRTSIEAYDNLAKTTKAMSLLRCRNIEAIDRSQGADPQEPSTQDLLREPSTQDFTWVVCALRDPV